MFDYNNPLDMERLKGAIEHAGHQLETFKSHRNTAIEEFVGNWYDTTSNLEQPVNLMALMVEIYLMHLAGSNPQVLMTTPRKDILPFAKDFEAVINQELKDMNFDATLRRWVQDALFGIGVMKCGLVDGPYVEIIPGEPQASQEYFADIIDLDDFAFDVTAKEWSRVTWFADRYEIDYEAAMESDIYDPDAVGLLSPIDSSNQDLVEHTYNNSVSHEKPLKQKAYVWDVYMPEEGVLITIPATKSAVRPLRVVEWKGPSHGPYHLLSFMEVPGRCLPLSPVSMIRDLNRLMNGLFRKISRQGQRSKNVTFVSTGQESEGKILKDASDGDIISVTDPRGISEVNAGRVNQELIALGIQVDQTFSKMAGNLDAMGGLGPQSGTFRQDAMIADQVSKKTAKMTTAVVNGTTKLIKDLAYYIWTDPIRIYEATRQVPGGIDIEVQLEPMNRVGKLENFNFDIVPYSMTYRSPQERSSSLNQIFMQVIAPMLPMMQQQGIDIDYQKFFELMSDYNNLPELLHILNFSGVPMPGTQDQSRQAPTTHRVNERVSRSAGMSSQGQAKEAVNAMMSNQSSESQQ